MSTFTENYNLIKPSEEDYYDVQDFNENMDAIDLQMALAEQAIYDVSEKIGTPAEEGQTVFSLLTGNSTEGLSVIKSLQRIPYTVTPSTTSGSCAINEVDPAKCLVIMERLKTPSGSFLHMDYTLNATSLALTHGSSGNDDNIFAFWIVEFY